MDWWAWPPLVAASLAGFGVIFKSLLKLARLVSTAEAGLPVLNEIARQFGNPNEPTLKEQLNRIETKMTQNGQAIKDAQSTAERAETMIVDHLQRGRRAPTTS